MNNVFVMILQLYGSNHYQQFVVTPSPRSCQTMLRSFEQTPMKIVMNTDNKTPNAWGEVKYGCISKKNMMQMSGVKNQSSDDDMNDVNETE